MALKKFNEFINESVNLDFLKPISKDDMTNIIKKKISDGLDSDNEFKENVIFVVDDSGDIFEKLSEKISSAVKERGSMMFIGKNDDTDKDTIEKFYKKENGVVINANNEENIMKNILSYMLEYKNVSTIVLMDKDFFGKIASPVRGRFQCIYRVK